MLRPWLLLNRVLHVNAPGGGGNHLLHAAAEEHDGMDVDDAEADAAEVVDAEDHVDAAAQEAQNAAAAEAEEGAQVHDAGDEAEGGEDEDEDEDAAGEHDVAVDEDVQMLLGERVIDVNPSMAVSHLMHALMLAEGGASDIAVTVAPPPRVSSLATRAHPDPARPDAFPYVVAAGRFCLLVHFSAAPFHGATFGQAPPPNHSHLVVVRHFLRHEDGIHVAACALRVLDRPIDVPALSNIESVGLVCDQATGHFLIAELIVTPGAPQVAVVYIGPQTGGWRANHFAPNLRGWVPHGTVTVNNTVLWYDLSWGLISCDMALPHEHQILTFHRVPPGRKLAGAGGVPEDIRCRRCVAVSANLVRYVEIILSPNGPAAATVNMWYRDLDNPPLMWRKNYSVSFGEIWEHESYDHTGLPRTIPMLVGVSPIDSNVVYFSLNQRLFGVDVPERTVMEDEPCGPLNRPGPDDDPFTSRYLIPWNLEAHGAINIGNQPDNPSDHGDSSEEGPADEGELNYESPPS